MVFRKLQDSPNRIIENTIADINKQFGKTYPWALGAGRDLPNAYVLPKRKKQFLSGRPIVSFFTAPFRPMLNCIAKMIYHLLPQAFPHNLAKGDVFDLIKLLKNTDFDNLPPEFTIKTWPASSPASTQTDLWTVGDSPWSTSLLPWAPTLMKSSPWKQPPATQQATWWKDALAEPWMWLAKSLFETSNASSSCPWRWPSSPSAPLSMNRSAVHPWVHLSVLPYVWWWWPFQKKFGTKPTIQPWPPWTSLLVYSGTLTTDSVWQTPRGTMKFHLPTSCIRSSMATLLSLRRNQIFCIEFEPFALCSPPRDFNQVMAPFSASPLAVQLSGFVSRLFLVAKCAHLTSERNRGFAALHRLYRAAGFSESDLMSAANDPTLPSRSYALVKWTVSLLNFVIRCFSCTLSEPSNSTFEQLSISFECTSVFCILSSLSTVLYPTTTGTTPSPLRCLRLRSRSKNRFFTSFSMMFIMRIYFYIEPWRCFLRLWYQILSQLHCRAPVYGTNPKASNQNILIRPMLFLTAWTSLHQTLMTKTTTWTAWCSATSHDLISIWPLLHRMPFLNLPSSLPRLPPLQRSARPKQLPKPLSSDDAILQDHLRAHLVLCLPGPMTKNRSYVHWNPMKSPDFLGGWSPSKWENLSMMFARCGTRSRTSWDDCMYFQTRIFYIDWCRKKSSAALVTKHIFSKSR